MRAWNWNVTDSKKDRPDDSTIYFEESKEMSHDFVRAQSVAETCFSPWGEMLYRFKALMQELGDIIIINNNSVCFIGLNPCYVLGRLTVILCIPVMISQSLKYRNMMISSYTKNTLFIVYIVSRKHMSFYTGLKY